MNSRCNKNRDNTLERDSKAEPSHVTIIMSKTNLPTIKIGDYLLHSSYDPVKEAKRLADIHYKKNHFHILFGLGLGYLAIELYKRMSKNDHLLIIEPEQQVFKLALKTLDFNALQCSKQVTFSIGKVPSALSQYFQFYLKEGYLGKVSYIESPNYVKLYPDFALEIAKLLKESSMLELINVNTFHHFSEAWQKNFLLNLYQAISAKPFSSLVNRLACPVIITAAGPSLTKQIPLLRTVQNRAFILCAGSTINSLLQGGVVPHAVVTVDGGEANYSHFKDLNIDSVPIIFSLTVHKEIPQSHSGAKVIFNDISSKLSQWTNRVLQRDIGLVRGGQSVANYCLDIACQMTSGPVCFVGQDLAYTGNITHASGNINRRELNPEEIQKQKKFTMATGYYGNLVLTDYIFLGMKKTFEQYIESLRKRGDTRPIINATEGGIMIEGARNMPLHDFIDSYCCKDHSESIAGLFEKKEADLPDWIHFYRKVNKEKEKIVRIMKLCCKAREELARIKHGKVIDQQILNKLDKIDRSLKKLLESDLMHYILQPVIFRVYHRYPELANETPEERYVRVLEKSRALYKEISEAASYTEKCIDELIEKIRPHLHA